jgi:hypothetical protein
MSGPWAWAVVNGNGNRIIYWEADDARDAYGDLVQTAADLGEEPPEAIVPLYPRPTCSTCRHSHEVGVHGILKWHCMRPGTEHSLGDVKTWYCAGHEGRKP